MQKWGEKRERQNYKCACCGHSFQNKRRKKKSSEAYWMNWYERYARNQRTLDDISKRIGITKRTLQKRFDTLCTCTGEFFSPTMQDPLAVVMDATHIGNVGILTLIRDTNKKNLYWYWSTTEKAEHYKKCLISLEHLGYSFSGFVIDGKPGVKQMLQKRYPGVPIQSCQKHQKETVKRYIPAKAKTEATRFLRRIAMRITPSFSFQTTTALAIWHILYKDFINEKTYSQNPLSKRKWWYTHKNIRSAYNSLKRNLPYLYTCEEYPHLSIPNTTNACDGYFSHLKERLNRHRGLSTKRKKTMTNFLLSYF